MNGLAPLLLVLVACTHYGYDIIATGYPDPASAARVWFYILRGIEGTALFFIVLSLVPPMPRRPWLSIAVPCIWGAIEEAQTSVCQLAVGINWDGDTGLFRGLCDVASGIPMYVGTALIVFFVFALKKE